MAKILVGRDKNKEVEVGNSLTGTKVTDTQDAEAKEELVEAPVKAEQVDAVEKGDDALSEAKAPVVKGRGKKRGKA